MRSGLKDGRPSFKPLRWTRARSPGGDGGTVRWAAQPFPPDFVPTAVLQPWQLAVPRFVSARMPEDAKHFRDRARDCRALAKGARYGADAAMLEEIAEELDDEARKIEAEKEPATGAG